MRFSTKIANSFYPYLNPVKVIDGKKMVLVYPNISETLDEFFESFSNKLKCLLNTRYKTYPVFVLVHKNLISREKESPEFEMVVVVELNVRLHATKASQSFKIGGTSGTGPEVYSFKPISNSMKRLISQFIEEDPSIIDIGKNDFTVTKVRSNLTSLQVFESYLL